MVQTSLAGSPAKRLILRASALALLVITALLFSYFRTGRAAIGVEESIVKVERKNFTQSRRLNGITQGSRSCVVLAPRLKGARVGSMVISKVAPAGPHIQKGDVLVEFEP